MLSQSDRNPVLVLVGPTAVGKTDLSLTLAERLDGEIISADSRLFYRGMDIGTAKPDKAELARIRHHLVDVANPDDTWSLARFQQAALSIIGDIQERGKTPLLVGGTGQYIHAIASGWQIPSQQPDLTLRTFLEKWGEEIGKDALHDILARLDCPAAEAIDARNVRRTIRALEVIFHTGRRFSEQRQRGTCPYDLLVVGLKRHRQELYQRIDERIQVMIDKGLLDEVKGLIGKGYSADLASFSGIGYREMTQVALGQISMDEAIVLMKRLTRQFVRRQANWFKEDSPDIHWYDAGTVTVDEIVNLYTSGAGRIKQFSY